MAIFNISGSSEGISIKRCKIDNNEPLINVINEHKSASNQLFEAEKCEHNHGSQETPSLIVEELMQIDV